jgi:hypothetical protein
MPFFGRAGSLTTRCESVQDKLKMRENAQGGLVEVVLSLCDGALIAGTDRRCSPCIKVVLMGEENIRHLISVEILAAARAFVPRGDDKLQLRVLVSDGI